MQAKVMLATCRAIITRLVFAAHGLTAIWQVTSFKNSHAYWYLSAPVILLAFEGIFTISVKKTQEWKWFCPSVFLYLTSVVPAIWLLELHKLERRLKVNSLNLTTAVTTEDLDRLFGLQLRLEVDAETWITLIEQFLMLILIVGRWMLPKGDLTRDQLSQLLLVYIGTAADIIEFFDSFKDEKIGKDRILVLLTLAIWSWSLLQFTVVLTATKSSRRSRLSSRTAAPSSTRCCGGTIETWGIALNILLQDAPFLAFRLLLIVHYRIISYMNVFFTCKNTLVIVLQLYRLWVVHAEARKQNDGSRGRTSSVAVVSISSPQCQRAARRAPDSFRGRASESESEQSYIEAQTRGGNINRSVRQQQLRQDTGYSTESSSTARSTSRPPEKNDTESGSMVHWITLYNIHSRRNAVAEEERTWQHRTAIAVLFLLYIMILIVCLVLIHSGISPHGLVLSRHT